MPEYRISGVWKDAEGVITHYAFHTKTEKGYTRATKMSKTQALALVEPNGNIVLTWIWNYSKSFWINGENVSIVNSTNGKYLRSNPDNKVTDNLGHLINYDWIFK